MLNSIQLATVKALRSVRYASVLAIVPPSPYPSPLKDGLHDSPHIVTPASSPLTTPSNNAFYPAFIPEKTKARLTLSELQEVLKSSKSLLRHLQNDYLARRPENRQLQDTVDSLETLMKEQTELQKRLPRRHSKKNNRE